MQIHLQSIQRTTVKIASLRLFCKADCYMRCYRDIYIQCNILFSDILRQFMYLLIAQFNVKLTQR